MFTSDRKLNDPNYANLKMLSFSYKPSPGETIPTVYGAIIEFATDPFSTERNFLVGYDSGFCAYYSTQNGGNINGDIVEYTGNLEFKAFEQFIASSNVRFPDASIASKSTQLVSKATGFLKHTKAVEMMSDEEAVQIYFLTSSGVFSATADLLQIKNKKSPWFAFFNEVNSIFDDIQLFSKNKTVKTTVSSEI